jgi:hypothetical protein
MAVRQHLLLAADNNFDGRFALGNTFLLKLAPFNPPNEQPADIDLQALAAREAARLPVNLDR